MERAVFVDRESTMELLAAGLSDWLSDRLSGNNSNAVAERLGIGWDIAAVREGSARARPCRAGQESAQHGLRFWCSSSGDWKFAVRDSPHLAGRAAVSIHDTSNGSCGLKDATHRQGPRPAGSLPQRFVARGRAWFDALDC